MRTKIMLQRFIYCACKLFILVCTLLDKQYANDSMKKLTFLFFFFFTHNLTAVVPHHLSRSHAIVCSHETLVIHYVNIYRLKNKRKTT